MSDDVRDRFEIPEGNAIDGGSELRAGPPDLREIRRRARRPPPAPSRSATPRFAPSAKDIGSKAIAYAEKNVQASLDYAQSLLKAKDLTEVMRLHSEYVQAQMRSLAEQASEMGQIDQQRRHGGGEAENLRSRHGSTGGSGTHSCAGNICGIAPEIALRCTNLT